MSANLRTLNYLAMLGGRYSGEWPCPPPVLAWTDYITHQQPPIHAWSASLSANLYISCYVIMLCIVETPPSPAHMHDERASPWLPPVLLKMMAAVCCLMLILTTAQHVADASPHQQGSGRRLLQLADPGLQERQERRRRQIPGFQNAPVRTSAKSPATRFFTPPPPSHGLLDVLPKSDVEVNPTNEGEAASKFPNDDGHGAVAAAGSAEDVASASCFSAFIEATSLLRRPRARAASLLGRRARVPRLSFMGASASPWRDKPGATPTPHQDGHPGSDDDASTDTYTVRVFPHLRFKLSEFAPMSASDIELHAKASAAVAAKPGHLESRYIDHWNRCIGPRAWPIGPLCLARYSHSVDDRVHAKPSWIRWLDEEAEVGRAVLYIALGTLAAIPEAQLKRAGVDFLWAVRPSNADLGTGFEDRVEGRARGSITAGVPMAVWPIEFEQPMNARFLVDELKWPCPPPVLAWTDYITHQQLRSMHARVAMASAGALKMMAAVCCLMLILTTAQHVADASPHQQGSGRRLLQLADREVVVARQPGFKNGRNGDVARIPGFQNAPVRTSAKSPATRVRINGPPN
ncbi:hypothetical protein HU200_042248 [Digitaria exilis]|uniref:Uncharacterized protein n=1 Tax=Digitaria exilis TaxID=1010633 RepID=A0A835EG12_9POAL|nr:hypothetical protein HU200_042248 [Digitaria exilis]